MNGSVRLIQNVDNLLAWIAETQSKTFAFDTETYDANYEVMKLSTLKCRSMQFYDGKEAVFIRWTDDLLQLIRYFFQTNIKTLIGHNLAYDLKVCKKLDIPFEHLKLYDTMIAHHLIDEESELGLKFLTRTILQRDVLEHKDILSCDVLSEKFIKYATDDVINTWDLCTWQQPKLKELGLVRLFREIEMPFLLCILEMEYEGIHVDTNKVDTIKNELINEIIDLEIQMYKTLGVRYQLQANLLDGSLIPKSDISFTSNDTLADILFSKLKLDIVEQTPSGKPAVGRKTIEILKDKHPFVMLLYKYKKAQKLLTAFFEPLGKFIDVDGKVRARFNNCGTVTGRLSSSNPNMQQLPKVNKDFPIDVRSCFVAPANKVMISCDYAGQELRVLTQITQEPALIDAFNKGKDIHLATANDFFTLGIPEEALYENGKDYDLYKKKFKAERDKAKIINFGIAYGKGAFGFAKDFNISEQEAELILQKYFRAMPGVKTSITNAEEFIKSKGYIVSMTGRIRHFKKDTDGKNSWYSRACFREGFNFLIQGFSADMMRLAAIAARKSAVLHPEWDMKAIASIHDEMLFTVKKEYAAQAEVAIRGAFENAVKFVIPVVAETGMGTNYGECK